jgi:hypothetical protein
MENLIQSIVLLQKNLSEESVLSIVIGGMAVAVWGVEIQPGIKIHFCSPEDRKDMANFVSKDTEFFQKTRCLAIGNRGIIGARENELKSATAWGNRPAGRRCTRQRAARVKGKPGRLCRLA